MSQSASLQRLSARSATAFLLAVLCVFPLYIDKFSNLGVVKFTGICTLTLGFFLWFGALALIGARSAPGRLDKRDPALRALGAVVLSGVLSTVLSLSPLSSFWGLGGYYGGCMMVLFTAAGYLAVRAFAPRTILNGLVFCIGVTTTLVTALYVLNIFNIDLIGAYADTAVVERAQFFSTLGQKNFNSGFMAFALPLVFYAFLSARGRHSTLLYAVPAFFGALALAVVDAEGLALGIGAAALWLICQKDFTARILRRMAVLGAFFFFHAGWMQYMRETVYTQGGTSLLAALGRYAVPGFALCAAVWVLLRFAVRSRQETPLWRAGRAVTAVLLAVTVLLFLLANFMPNFPSLGRLDELLIFNDDWGTYRGTAWRITWSTWLSQPLWRKLLGTGLGTMHTAVAAWAGESITERMQTFYAAHNEYLELLLTAGAAGLAAWLWFCAAHLRQAVKNRQRPGVMPVMLALVSYLAHAVVSIRVSMIFPEIMLLFALLSVFCRPPEEEAAPLPTESERAGRKKRGHKKAKGKAVPAGAARGGTSADAAAPDPAAPRALVRRWLPPAFAALAAMLAAAPLSRVLFRFLF